MNWTALCGPRGEPPFPEPGLPRRLLRGLFEARQIGVGSRVLDVGCGGGSLLRFLNNLCLDVSGLDESPANVEAVRRLAPELSCFCGRAQDPLPFPPHSFNLVLARDLSVFEGDLFGYGALLTTARLITAIRPGGSLLIVRQPIVVPSLGTDSHHDRCYLQHLQTFASEVSVTHVSTGWKWVPWQKGESAWQIASLQVPPRALDLKDWLRIAKRAASASLHCECRPQKIVPLRKVA